jgi:hypothetical protein
LGLVTDNGDGTFTYDPNGAFDDLGAGQTASDSFEYTVDDGNGGSDTATVTITVNGIDAVSPFPIDGSDGGDSIAGTDGDDAIRSFGGSFDRMSGGGGADQFIFGAEALNGVRERDVILDYEVGIDSIVLEDGASIGSIRQASSSVVIFLEGDRDVIQILGEGVTADNLTIVTDDEFEVA